MMPKPVSKVVLPNTPLEILLLAPTNRSSSNACVHPHEVWRLGTPAHLPAAMPAGQIYNRLFVHHYLPALAVTVLGEFHTLSGETRLVSTGTTCTKMKAWTIPLKMLHIRMVDSNSITKRALGQIDG